MRGLGKRRGMHLDARSGGQKDDRGAISILVALLLAAGVLTGLLGLVIDGGRMYAERRVVQNGADAAALAVSQDCALKRTECASQAAARAAAATFANSNASDDGRTSIAEICGSAPLNTCPSLGSSPSWSNCQTAVTGNYVRVRTQTESAKGDGYFLPIFAGVLSNGVGDRVSVGACSQVKWGPAASAGIKYPFLLPACTPLLDEGDKVIEDFDPNNPDTSCTVDGVTYNPVSKGFAFGSLPDQTKTCVGTQAISPTMTISVETSLTQLCGKDISQTLDEVISAGVPILLPVVGAHTQTGQGQYEFTVIGFKSFTLRGYRLKNNTGGAAPAGGWNATVCGQGAKRSCIHGSVGRGLVSGSAGGGSDFGVRAIQMIP
ncbi:MAG: hypothetical protein F2793_03880 [Actinobacteria bacterium]|uniref:Unannotated protein n=1 Tax=freshwater metagenome TaxID=449393 RepID=A0A6J7DUQ7_9ZZZZ|nr:hypothetical protein [Actinomycetota bacterium]